MKPPTPLLILGQTLLLAASLPTGPLQDPLVDRRACPGYLHYSSVPHPPRSEGPLALPFQRPAQQCRTFKSDAVEKVIRDVTSRMKDPDLARLFENAFPNTLDTTVSWHARKADARPPSAKFPQYAMTRPAHWDGVQSFIVTGDITAEWLRDSANQLQVYQALAPRDEALRNLILGAINTQAEFVIQFPYCNAFQPPPPSGLSPLDASGGDLVSPVYDSNVVFECKYELDSLAHFLKLGNEFFHYTHSTAFLTDRWYSALESVMEVVEQQSLPTFNETTGALSMNEYRFRRQTTIGTETLNLQGLGNPFQGGTGLVRSAFRPSDDATILPLFIPANAFMAVELQRTAKVLSKVGKIELASKLTHRAALIKDGIEKHGVVKHAQFGDVYAFEVDGYGSHIIMDDANIPSLLALPAMGFVSATDRVYQNTRKMLLQRKGNPYYLSGDDFSGIGGPHIGLRHPWPMSRLVQAMTSNDDEEIMESISAVKNSSRLGLVHESVNVDLITDYTRSWFAWANSLFAQAILDIAARKPHLLFGRGAEPYKINGGPSAGSEKPS